MKYIVAVKITLRLGGMHTRLFQHSGDCSFPFSSASMPKSLQTAATAWLINEISASPAAGSPDSVVEPSRVRRSLLLFLIG